MSEPSVLDYVKTKLQFWRKDLPEIDIESSEELDESAAIPEAQLQPETEPDAKIKVSVPWKIALAAGLALVAQWSLEPPVRSALPAVTLYFLAAVLLILSLWSGELSIPALKENSTALMPTWIRRKPFYIGLVLMLLAFLTFGGNRFNFINLTLWIIVIGFMLRALWIKGESSEKERFSFLEKIKQPEWNLHITRWSVLVFLVFALCVWFRFYHLGQVPGEAFSDHAEKLLDVNDVLNGQTSIFFPRNTGREAIQMYLTALIILVFNTGVSFMSLKLGTVLAGVLTLPYIYLVGKEIGNRWIGLLAMLMAGIAYWPNVISRVGLRFPLYPLFAAPLLYYLIRGLRTSNRNDFILAGIALGLGLHGYSSMRIVPVVVVIGVAIYLIHAQSKGKRKETIFALIALAFISLVIFLPLARYWLENPEMFNYRAFSRVAPIERGFSAPLWLIFLGNLWNASTMFFWNNGNTWVHSVVNRPALDVVTAAFFFIGCLSLLVRYIRERNWLDLFLLLSIPLLMLPSTLSLAFPEENPCLNRTGGAIIPAFVIAALGFYGVFSSLLARARDNFGKGILYLVMFGLLMISTAQNYDLVFHQYRVQFMSAAWNSSDMGETIQGFVESVGSEETAYVIPYPYWVDTRLVGINAGFPDKDYALQPDDISSTLSENRTKLFIVNPKDTASIQILSDLYPAGIFTLHPSIWEGRDYLVFLVPADNGLEPEMIQ